jgi:coenzyme F420-reducing hydrogenase alpha subunit
VKFRGKAYMLGEIARIKNNGKFLTKNSREKFVEFLKERKISEKEYFKNIFHNLFSQAIEVLHFLEVSQELLKEILKLPLKEEKSEIYPSDVYLGTSGLSALEAPREPFFIIMKLTKMEEF